MAKAMREVKITSPSAEGIAAAAKAASKGRALPPVHQWNPAFSGDLDIRITRDGTWLYLGSPIARREMVRLFSTILRKDGDKYFLVTPVEKVGITVDDAPFIALDFEVSGTGEEQRLTFLTNVGDATTVGPEAPIRIERDNGTGEPSPYVLVRDNLEALIDRKSFYRLVDIGVHFKGWFGLWSGGAFFGLTPSDELPTV